MPAQASLSAALTHRMNYLVARQGLISSNIANANTPGYHAQDLEFQKLYGKQSNLRMAGTTAGQIQSTATAGEGKLTTDTSNMTLNGNSVQVDVEMLKLNETQLHYQMNTQLYSKYASMQRLAIGKQQ